MIREAALSAIDIATLVIWGGASHPAVRRANELLGIHLSEPRVSRCPAPPIA